MSYLGVLLLLGLLIVIHEAGHLAAAKLMGIPVTGFSVGLGPKLWQRRWGQVEYSLRAFPLGGFVILAARDEYEMSAIPLAKRLAFFLGGPLANLAAVLPVFALWNGVERGWSFSHSVVAPFEQLYIACRQLLEMLAGLFSHPQALAGVVGIVVEGGRAAQAGMALEVAISLSISLAVLNLLPIPILDGGQILMAVLEKLFPAAIRLRVPLTVLGMIVLATVMVYANVQDVVRWWAA